jgi:hypothetical protein
VNGEEGEISEFADGDVFKIFPPVKIKRYMFKNKDGVSKAVSVNQIQLKQKLKNNIRWTEPDFYSEMDEYFDNEMTEKFLKDHGFDFDTEDELIDFLEGGKLINITKEELFKDKISGNGNFITKDDDKFKQMDDKLVKYGTITLPAPIILKFDDKYYKFSGNRRINLAFKYDSPLKIWLIKI